MGSVLEVGESNGVKDREGKVFQYQWISWTKGGGEGI